MVNGQPDNDNRTDLILTDQKNPEFESFLHEKIMQFNNRHSRYHRDSRAPGAIRPLNIIVAGPDGCPAGGLSASTYWDWLDIEDLYLPGELRGKGLGSVLLSMAENEALNRGCRHCRLTTYEFQARVFYQKRGYVIAGQLDGYPPGSVYYWMRKDLDAPTVLSRHPSRTPDSR
jgi:GNAT superfamily N-acetyltransferase